MTVKVLMEQYAVALFMLMVAYNKVHHVLVVLGIRALAKEYAASYSLCESVAGKDILCALGQFITQH